jgi:hypothetical protein
MAKKSVKPTAPQGTRERAKQDSVCLAKMGIDTSMKDKKGKTVVKGKVLK